MLFLGEEHDSGNRNKNVSGINRRFGQIRIEKLCNVIHIGVATGCSGKLTLELPSNGRDDSKRCLEIPLGCWAFCENGNDQIREDSFPRDEGCSLRSEGKGGERQGVWASFSTGKNTVESF